MFPFLPIASAALGAGLDIYNYLGADSAQKKAQNSLDILSAQPWERYSVNPAINRYYQTATNMAANPYGFTQGERSNFTQNLGRTINANQAYAKNITGGNLGKALNFLSINPTINAMNSFAAQDAGLRRDYQNNALNRQFQGANIFQNIDNMNIQNQLARRMQMLQAYGNAVNSNRDYKRNLLSGLGNDLLGAGFMSIPMFGKSTSTIGGIGLNPNQLSPYESDLGLPATSDVLKGLRGNYYRSRI